MLTIFQSLWMCMNRLAEERTHSDNDHVYDHQMYKTTEPEVGTKNWCAIFHVGHPARTSKGVALRTRRWVAGEGRDFKEKGKIEHKTYKLQNLVNP